MKEPTSGKLKDWFVYRADLKKQGIRLTLKQIADKTSYDYGYVRNMFSLWEKLTGQDHQ